METFSALLAICTRNSPVTGEFPLKGQWRGALMFYLICAWIDGWVNNRDARDLRRHRAHYDVTVIIGEKGPMPPWYIAVMCCKYMMNFHMFWVYITQNSVRFSFFFLFCYGLKSVTVKRSFQYKVTEVTGFCTIVTASVKQTVTLWYKHEKQIKGTVLYSETCL